MTPLYSGIHAARRRDLPPSLPLWVGDCDMCQSPIIAHAQGLRRHREFWNQRGIKMSVVCPDCATHQLEEHGGIEVMEMTREVEKHFCRG